MKKIEKILQYIDNQGIDIAEFERNSDISNAYLRNTEKRGADITQKILDRIREKQPNIYYKIFTEESNGTQHQEPQPNTTTTANSDTMQEDYRIKYERLLEKTNAEQSVLLMGAINRIDANLKDAAYNQHVFRVMTAERQRVMLENMALLRGLTRHELVHEADSIAAAQLDEYEKMHSESLDTVGK